MGRYWRVYRTFFTSSVIREMEFRANFFAKILQNVVWIVFFLLILFVVYSNTKSVAGWDRGDALVLTGSVFLLSSIWMMFFLSIQEIPQQVRMGVLDYVITKPVDTQFWVSTRKFNLDQFGALFAGSVILEYGLKLSGVHPTLGQWAAYAILVASAIVIFYSFVLALMTTGIWLVRVDNLWVLAESTLQVVRFPVDIYSLGIQRLFTFVVPMAFLSTIPARQLVKGADLTAVGLGVAWALAAFVGARWFWNYALRHYGSASS